MASEKTEALVIRQADFSESSRVVTFFTRDWGKVTAVAKGGRRLKGPFEAALDLLTVCRIVFIHKSSASLDILTEAELIRRFRPASRDLTCWYGGYYVAELLDALTEETDPHPELYRQSRETLQQLAENAGPQLAILHFELTVLQEIGQMPSLEMCVDTGEPVTGQRVYGFSPAEGGVVSPQYRPDNSVERVVRVHAGTLAVLQKFRDTKSTLRQRLAVSDDQWRQMRRLVGEAISHAMGRRPKMLRFLE